ncbi:BZIP transcription factor [Coniochaeta sp. 2T2.1]|nr:BZIP transcription factor [Coniochaeta sp. 2T2.1]
MAPASGEQPSSAVQLPVDTSIYPDPEFVAQYGTQAAKPAEGEGDRKRSRTVTDDGGYNSSTSQTYGGAQTQDEDGRAKKRRPQGKNGVASRGVANLTPEQLEKKRANDREAQRAIRERTKTQIESLQREIEALKSQQPQLELQAALQAKQEVEAELLDIKRRLASVMSMIQPIVAGPDPFPHPYNLRMQRPAPSSIHNASTPSSVSAPSPAPIAPPGPPGHWMQQNNDMAPTGGTNPSPPAAVMQSQQVQGYPQAKLLTQQRHELIHGFDFGAERLGLDFLLDHPDQQVARIQNGVNGAQDSPQFNHVPMKHDWATGVMQQAAQQSHPSRGGQAPNNNTTLPSSSSYSPPDTTYAGFSAPVKNCPPTCPLDSLLLDFLHERHQRAAEGLSAQEIIGPRYPSVSSLLNPSVSRYSHPLSKVFTDILQTFPDLSALPERVAVLYIMFLIMRWQISPTRENYDRLPDWATPRPSQLFTPHPAWMDHLPFPRMREKLVRDYYGPQPTNSTTGGGGGGTSSSPHSGSGGIDPSGGDNFPFENFFIPYTTTLCLNWPYEAIDVLLQSPDTEELMVNPVFERHLRRLENWTLGDAFAKAFPGLVDTFNYKSESADGAVKLTR